MHSWHEVHSQLSRLSFTATDCNCLYNKFLKRFGVDNFGLVLLVWSSLFLSGQSWFGLISFGLLTKTQKKTRNQTNRLVYRVAAKLKIYLSFIINMPHYVFMFLLNLYASCLIQKSSKLCEAVVRHYLQ